MAKTKREDDGRDIWDKIIDISPIVAGPVAGGILGRSAYRRIARKNLPDGPRGVRAGDKIITEDGVRIATKKNEEMFRRMDAADVRRAGRFGATVGSGAGFIGGTGAVSYNERKRRK